MNKYIIMYGNPIEGFTFVGPFDTKQEAIEYVDAEPTDYDTCIAELLEPAK